MAQPAPPDTAATAPPPVAPPVVPPAVPEALVTLAALHRLRQQILARQLVATLRRFWALVDPTAAQDSWDRLAGAQAVRLVSVIQAEAARGAQDYVATAVGQWGATSEPAGLPNPGALAGVAADGRPLDTLLSYPAFEVDAFVAQGMDSGTALAIGQRHLERIAVTTVQDAARVATGVAQVNDKAVHGYVRMLTPPSCSRCVVLAGKFYATNAGFERHPLCDCVHIPAVEHLPDVTTDPKRYFDSLTGPEQDATFTKAGAQAIRDGADIGQVVNARRGIYTAGGQKLTREGATRRGFAGKRLGAPKGKRAVRLMPEQIYREANGSRDEAIRLLKQHGYIV